MENVIKSKVTALLSLALIGALYLNFDWASLVQVPIHGVNQETRVAHAREILGRHYRGSAAHKAESMDDLNITLYQEVRKRLPNKHRHEALRLAQAVLNESEKYKFDPVFVLAVIETESHFNPKARGFHGEIGLMQIKPDTAQWIAERDGIPFSGPGSLENPVENVKIGTAYFNYLRQQFEKKPQRYVAAYNMGAANVRKLERKITFTYSQKVLSNYYLLYSRMVTRRMPIVVAYHGDF